MGLFKPTAEEKAAIKRMKEADRRLNENSNREHRAGIDWETPEYHRLNDAANEAAAQVPRRFGGTKR